ncbi:hypothetical protein KSS87_018711 [Heliosperma pusillum]|nr:hypothetical protein KSS87_018711 [Heliosperma pusillum]
MAENGGSNSEGSKKERKRVGLIYDDRMCDHHTPDGVDHPECPDRIRVILDKLTVSSLIHRCEILKAKEAEDKHIQLVHSKYHVDMIKTISSKQFDSKRKRIASQFNSIYLNKGSSKAAYLAAGSVLEAAEKVAKGDLDSAFAIVRPPGHHAEPNEPMGFCFFNNVAVAASYLLNERPELGIRKILIVDWDVHHGNGTQKMFWKDSRVLFFSVHRHDFGCFYPGSDDGSHTMIGEGPGEGYNINVPWEHGRCGDPDYFAVWDHVLTPVAKEFKPDLVIVSAGFDAAVHDPLGGCCITPYGYSVLLSKLMEFAQGKIVLALEGGYNLQSLAHSAQACVQVLLEEKPINGSSDGYPFESTWRVIENVRQNLSKYWPSLSDKLPRKLTSRTAPPSQLLIETSSDSEVENIDDAVSSIIQPLSELKFSQGEDQLETASSTWRKELRLFDVWYATYGSNMWTPRFLCYIQGGQKSCWGSMDKSPPKETLWKSVSHRIFFGRESTRTWGPGGVAFLHPQSTSQDKSHICMYRITLEQFNDVLFQENMIHDTNSPLFDLEEFNAIKDIGSFSPVGIETGWYHNVVLLGEEQGIPILTMTCDLNDVEGFKSGKQPLVAPANNYANTLIRGLAEVGPLSQAEASAYVADAARKPL